jgi:two-component system, OmpR family, sensor kinase
MIASLRGRLVAGVLALAAAAMLVVGGVTYAEQRSFQLSRVDSQLSDATIPLANELAGKIGGGGDYDHDGPHHGGPPPGGGAPSDTYGQLRDEGGRVLASGFLGPVDHATAPSLPASLPVGRAVTVGDHRVLATDLGSGIYAVVAVPLAATNQSLNRLLLVEGIVIGGVLVLLGVFAWVVVRVGLLPLDRMGHTAAAIAGGDLSHRVGTTDPRTEVGRLGLALNRMLDRLEQAFAAREASQERLRRFIADASHELRTPLASIRGYAELFRMGATREPEEVEKSMRRIEEEAARMGVLVEDLLTLARLDEVREAEHTEVDLAALARDAVDDARATAPERDIGLSAEPADVSGDADQLRQVLANLLRNALVHTPAGTPVEVSVTRQDGEVTLRVRDHGPGLPTDDADVLFERFWRAEGGRERGRGGAGLGLAIVAGIVDAHGGQVSAGNAPDGGAVFTVRLPSQVSA